MAESNTDQTTCTCVIDAITQHVDGRGCPVHAELLAQIERPMYGPEGRWKELRSNVEVLRDQVRDLGGEPRA